MTARRLDVAIPVALLAPAIAAFLWHVSVFDTIADDAFITFRYARDLARGLGPVWNPGERVEGYSNLLWMLVLALAHAVLRTDIPSTARFLGVLSGALTIAAVFELVSRLTRSSFWGAVAAAVLAFSSSFAAHAPNGLESSTFALFVLLVALALLRASTRLAFAALVGVSLLRFEGVLVVALAGLAAALAGWSSRSTRSLARAAAAWAPVYVAANVWRRAYYGSWIPNSVAAKEGRAPDARIAQGTTYLRGFFDAENVIALLVVIAAIAVAGRLARTRSPAGPAFAFLVLTAAGYTAFVVWIGGCWMPAWRMMAHVVPAFVASGVVAASWLAAPLAQLPRVSPLGRLTVAMFCVWSGMRQIREVSRTHANLEPRVAFWREQVRGLGEMGRWLERTLPRRATVATVAAGALPYYARDLRCLDVLGLTDAHIARAGNKDPNGVAGHIASDWPYVLARAPDVYVSTGGGGFGSSPAPRVERVLQGRYVPVVFEFTKTTNTQGRYVTLMLRADEEQDLRRALASDPDVRAL